MKSIVSKASFLNRLPISGKIVIGTLTFGAVAIVATTLLVGNAVKSALDHQFQNANTEITKLLATNAAGGLRWKKAEAIEAAYKAIASDERAPTFAIVATDLNGEIVAAHETGQLSATALADVINSNLSVAPGATVGIIQDNAYIVIAPSGQDAKSGKPYGILAVAWRTDYLQQIIAAEQRNMVLILAAVFIVLAIGIVFLMRSVVSQPLARVAERIASLAAGDTESAVPYATREDEIGKISSAVEDLAGKEIERIRLEEQQKSEDKAQTERQEKRETMTRDFRGTVAELIEVMGSQMEKMRSTGKDLSLVASMTSQQTETVSASSSQSSENVQVVSSAAEELSASIREIGAQIRRTTEVITNADEQARTSAQKMGNLAEVSNKIGAVVGLIRDIAEQTNLLALNATIEAARAGESGKGFAVVASEVKTLATQTANATDEIAKQISQIQTATHEAEDDIGQIVKTMAEASDLAIAISSGIEQQSAAIEEVTGNISGAAESAKNVVEAIDKVAVSAADTETASREVDLVSNEVDGNINSLRAEVDQFSANLAAL